MVESLNQKVTSFRNIFEDYYALHDAKTFYCS